MEVKMKMGLFLGIVMVIIASSVNGDSKDILVKTVKAKKVCSQGWECKGWSKCCCNQTIWDLFQVYQFEELFAKRNTPVAHAVGFWDYQSFITAAAVYEPLGLGATGGKLMQMKEIAAFFGHVLSEILDFSQYPSSLFGERLKCIKLDKKGFCPWKGDRPTKSLDHVVIYLLSAK